VRDTTVNRVASFGEFLDRREESDSRLDSPKQALRELLLRFHPATRPVLWRVLVTQVLVYEALERSRNAMSTEGAQLQALFADPASELATELTW
jgi:hypothetical protein